MTPTSTLGRSQKWTAYNGFAHMDDIHTKLTKYMDNLFHLMPQHSWYESAITVPLIYTRGI